MPIKKLTISILLVLCFISSYANAAGHQQLLLVVPEITGQTPSANFISIIHSAVSYLGGIRGPLKVNIISVEPLSSEYAKIILHSYGLKNDQIDILPNISSLITVDLEDLEVFGNIADKDRIYLSLHNVVYHQKDLSNDLTTYIGLNSSTNGDDLGIIALGTGPLDGTTPSLDMVKRVEKATKLLEENPQAICIFSGGRTAGPISEARMMFLIAYARGIPPPKVLLEEASRTTVENAQLTAQLVHDLPLKRFILVTRPTHMKRALSDFRSHPEFKDLEPQATDITQGEIIDNLNDYMAFNPSARAKYILNKVLREFHDDQAR